VDRARLARLRPERPRQPDRPIRDDPGIDDRLGIAVAEHRRCQLPHRPGATKRCSAAVRCGRAPELRRRAPGRRSARDDDGAALAFVAEGAALPIKQDVFANTTVGPTRKMALGVALTAELEFSNPETATAVIQTAMREQAGKSLDAAVFSTAAADSTRPAGILNGVTPITASTATPLDQAMFRDIEALVGAIADAGGGGNVWLFASPRQAGDQAGADRIDAPHEYDRHCAGLPLQRRRNRGGHGHNDIRRERDQFRRVLAIAVGVTGGPARVDPHVAAGDPAQFREALQESRQAGLSFRIVRSQIHEHADAAHAPALLRAPRAATRPRRRAA
jgi:hypothetical protein